MIMIKSTITLTDAKEFEVECEKCSKVITRKVEKEFSLKLEDIQISNTDSAFCDECKELFIKWIRKNYPQDCWCKHIEEYNGS